VRAARPAVATLGSRAPPVPGPASTAAAPCVPSATSYPTRGERHGVGAPVGAKVEVITSVLAVTLECSVSIAPKESLAGRRALVTGGTKGVGAAVARKLAEAGATALVTA